MEGPKTPRPYEYSAWGVLNPYGDMWGPDWFEGPDEALQHVRDFFKHSPGMDLAGFKAVPVTVLLTPFNLECARPLEPETPPPVTTASRSEQSARPTDRAHDEPLPPPLQDPPVGA